MMDNRFYLIIQYMFCSENLTGLNTPWDYIANVLKVSYQVVFKKFLVSRIYIERTE